MHSGCLTAETLDLFVSGSIKGYDIELVEQHLSECPLCADAAEGLRPWLKEKSSNNENSENPNSASPELAIGQSFEHSSRLKSQVSKPSLFQNRTNALNEQIWQQIHKYKLVGPEPGKHLSFKPFVWLAAAA